MVSAPIHVLSAEVLAKWEKLYHLLGRGYGYIAQHPNVEVEILGSFASIGTACIEGTTLEKEYRIFPTLFVNFLRAYQDADQTVIVARIMKARNQDQLERLELTDSVVVNHKKAIKSAQEHVSLLVCEREKLVECLVSIATYFEHDSSDILMKFRCDWLEERIQDITTNIALERELIRNLGISVEHQETSIARLKEKCTDFFFMLADLDS